MAQLIASNQLTKIDSGGRNYFKDSRSRTYTITSVTTQDFRTSIYDEFWKNDKRFIKSMVRISLDVAFSPALPQDISTNVHFSASPWYGAAITFKGGTTERQHFDLVYDLSGATNTYKTDNVFIRFNNNFPLNTKVSIDNANLYISSVREDYRPAVEELEAALDTKADQALTQRQLNIRKETLNMGIISSGQITITDLSDAPVLSAFITATQTTTQVFDQTSNSYNPSYASSPQVLTLNLTKAGQATSILSQASNVTWYEYNGTTKTQITSTTSTDSQYLSGAKKEQLTTKVNVPTNTSAKRYEAVGTWTDPITGLQVDFRASIDLLAIQLGKQSLVLNVYTGKGNTFYNDQPANLTINADLYKGNTLSNGSKQIKFFYSDSSVSTTSSPGYDADGGIGWRLCNSTTTGQTPNVEPTADTSAQGVLTVLPSAVVNSQTYKVVCIDKVGGTSGQKATGVATILDFSDPIVVVIESTAGNTFKNSTGSTSLKARLYRKGEELDTAGTGYTYKWSKRDKNGVLDAQFGGTGNQYKTGKAISVSASEVADKSTYFCEVFE